MPMLSGSDVVAEIAAVSPDLPTTTTIDIDAACTAAAEVEWALQEATVRGAELRVAEGGRLTDVLADVLIVGDSHFEMCPRSASRRGSCPVIVLRGRQRQPLRRIVVGIDGSNASTAALDWAIDEAIRHSAELTVVHAWQRHDRGLYSLRTSDRDRADAQLLLEHAVDHSLERMRPFKCVVGCDLIEGSPSAALTTASNFTDVDLLVMGSRGASGFKTMLFGSVAQFVLENADCPVAVINPRLRSAE
jgi:nucleotide-binding universal stress UspA family protein